MTDKSGIHQTTDQRWLGWAIDRPGHNLFVQYGGDERDAWIVALGWPSNQEIENAKSCGARAFRVEIREIENGR